jgi:inner membrane protein
MGTKVGMIGVLAVMFLIPIAMVDNLLEERLARRDQALNDIRRSWGEAQTILGPFLLIPYIVESTRVETAVADSRTGEILCRNPDSLPSCASLIGSRGSRVQTNNTKKVREEAVLDPESIKITGSLDVKELARGIYRTPVYTADLTIEGSFSLRSPALQKRSELLWGEARLVIGVRDVRGIRKSVSLNLNGEATKFLQDETENFLAAPVVLAKDSDTPVSFSIPLRLAGTTFLRFVASSGDMAVSLKANWPHPSFSGDALPSERTITKEGFDARWQVTNYLASAPSRERVWSAVASGAFDENGVDESDFTATRGTLSVNRQQPSVGFGPLFGVSLAEPVDSYRSVERAMKYGVLVVALIFLTVFVCEVLTELRIHPIQYALVGLALSMFFLCLLSTSEFIPFDLSYGISSALCTGIITLYCWAVLRGGLRAAAIAASLIGTYGLLFVALRAEDFSLLVGTGGLFAALSVLMYVTRGVDWYGTQGKEP